MMQAPKTFEDDLENIDLRSRIAHARIPQK